MNSSRAIMLALIVVLVGLAVHASTASAGYHCVDMNTPTAFRDPGGCEVTLTATAADPSRSGSTAATLTLPGGTAVIECSNSTYSVLRHGTGQRELRADGRDVSFTGCVLRVGGVVSPGCVTTATAVADDRTWRIHSWDDHSGMGPVRNEHAHFNQVGALTFEVRTCAAPGSSTGTVRVTSGQRVGTNDGRGCMTFNNDTGIFNLASCPLEVQTDGRLCTLMDASNRATLSVAWHAVASDNGTQSLTQTR